MNLLNMLLNDPVVIYSLVGLLTLFGICGYYVWFFLKNIEEDK